MKNQLLCAIVLGGLILGVDFSRVTAGGGGGGSPEPDHLLRPLVVQQVAPTTDSQYEALRMDTLGKYKVVRYGDEVVLVNKGALNCLNDGPGVASEASLSGITFADQVPWNNNDKKPAANLRWIIKGKHKKGDRWNCQLGTEVKSGDIIRLEASSKGTNLSVSSGSLVLAGNAGVGSAADNWQIDVQGGSWKWGAPFTLVNVDSNNVLFAEGSGLNIEQAQKRREAVSKPKNAQESLMADLQAQSKAAGDEKQKQQNEAQAAQASNNGNNANGKDNSGGGSSGGSSSGSGGSGGSSTSATPSADAQTSAEKPHSYWWTVFALVSKPPEEDIGWTGAPYGSAAEDDDLALFSIEIVKLGMGGGIAPKMTQDFQVLSADKRPYLSGYAKDQIDGFDQSFMLRVNPLVSKGAAWLEQSLSTPGKFTIQFVANAEDKGDIQVVIGYDVSVDFAYKIRIGGWDNTRSAIIKREMRGGQIVDNEVFSLTPENNPLAVTTPGSFVPYWVSLNDGLILVGAGNTPGENVFMSWRDSNPPQNMRRVGFATHKTGVTYAEVLIRPPVDVKPPQRQYYPINPIGTSAKADATAAVTWLTRESNKDVSLRVPGKGSFGFDLKGDKEVYVYLAPEKSPKLTPGATAGLPDHYLCIFGVDDNDGVRVKKYSDGKYKDLAFSSSKNYPGLRLNKEVFERFWLSVNYGDIMIGTGNIGTNLALVAKDLQPLENISYIGVAKGGDVASFGNFMVSSRCELAVNEEEESYQREAKRFDYKGSVKIILPFEYQVDQEGQSVKFVDHISNKTYYPGATPQQDAKYFFMITVQANGFPQLDWVTQPENPKKLEIEKKAAVLKATADALAQAGMSISGSGMIGGVIGTAISAVYTSVGVGVANVAAQTESQLKNYRDHDSYVFTDKLNPDVLGSSSVPPEAQANQADAKAKIELGGKWKPSSAEKFERLISLYQQVIYLVNHPYVVQNVYIKKNLFDGISSLYQARKVLYPGLQYEGGQAAYNALMNLLISAHNNPYLIDLDNPDEAKQKDVWYTWINDLSRDLLADHAVKPVELLPYFGEYVWINDKMPAVGKGTIVFEARGINDAFICFGKEPFKVRNSTNEIYEVVFGGWENKKTAIRIQSLDRPVVAITKDYKPEAMLNQLDYRRFWVSVNSAGATPSAVQAAAGAGSPPADDRESATILIGHGEIKKENILISWNDPYPIADLRYVGLSTWNAPITFRNVFVGDEYSKVKDGQWDVDKTIADFALAAANAGSSASGGDAAAGDQPPA